MLNQFFCFCRSRCDSTAKPNPAASCSQTMLITTRHTKRRSLSATQTHQNQARMCRRSMTVRPYACSLLHIDYRVYLRLSPPYKSYVMATAHQQRLCYQLAPSERGRHECDESVLSRKNSIMYSIAIDPLLPSALASSVGCCHASFLALSKDMLYVRNYYVHKFRAPVFLICFILNA